MATVIAPPLDPTAPGPVAGRNRPSLSRAGWATYVIAWALVGLCIAPVLYIIWGQYVAATAGTSTMATYMVVNGRNAANYGYGSAVAVVLFVISLVVALTYQRFVLRRDTEGALTEGKK